MELASRAVSLALRSISSAAARCSDTLPLIAPAELAKKFEGAAVPLPPYWGGYLVVPKVIEFWQGRVSRLHDRLEYRRDAAAWTRRRLSP